MTKSCRICREPLEAFMSFGSMPLANGFLTQDQFANEYFFELKVGVCSSCWMFQLMDQPPPEKMFHADYPFYTGSSSRMAAHFELFAQDLHESYLESPHSSVVEIGSNDGTFLRYFADRGIRHLGIEPSQKVLDKARELGVNARSGFFDERTAREVIADFGRVDVFVGTNVFCHVADPHQVIRGIQLLLKPGGVAVFEDPYLGDVLEKTSYDQIYDEHVSLFSVSSLQYLFGLYGMELSHAQRQWTHGGSLRYFVNRKGEGRPDITVQALDYYERESRVNRIETYLDFKLKCEESRKKLRNLLLEFRKNGKRVMAYGATSKSTTVTNYCDIGPDLVEAVCDTTPVKQGKFTPGKHIPVVPHESFVRQYPDCALLFAWNHAAEIMAKEKDFSDQGGQWMIYVPTVEIISHEPASR